MKNKLLPIILATCFSMSASRIDIYTIDGLSFQIDKRSNKEIDDFITFMESTCQRSRKMFRMDDLYVMADKISHFIVRGREKHPEHTSIFTFREGKK